MIELKVKYQFQICFN